MNIQNLPNVLEYRAETIGERPVYHYMAPRATAPQSLTFRELHEQTCALALALKRSGLEGKNAVLMYPPGLDFIKIFFACMRANISAIPMYIPAGNTPDTRLRSIMQTVDIAAVLTIKVKEEQVRNLTAELWQAKECLIISTDVLTCEDISRVSLSVELAVNNNQIPLIQFTSGSTSNPKGVLVSHANIINNQQMIQRGFHRHANTVDGESMVSWLPFFHDMGLICSIMHPIFIGGDVVLMSPTDFLQNPHKWLQLISMYSASISGAPNFAYEYCVTRIKDEQLDGLDLSNWRVAYNGAEMIRPLTMKRFCDRFGAYGFRAESIFYCYGMAETTLYVSGNTGTLGSVEAPDEIARVGPPDEKSEVVIAGENNNALADGEVGEVWVRGPHVALGYINNPEATQKTFHAKINDDKSGPSYLRTGDLGYMRSGNLYIVGRLKNLIVVNGKNYFGEEIEQFVCRCHEYFVESGACILHPNEGLSNAEIIFMQEIHKSSIGAAKSELPELEEKAIELSRRILNNFGLSVHRFMFVRAGRIPRTSSGKIDRARAYDLALSGKKDCLLEVQTR